MKKKKLNVDEEGKKSFFEKLREDKRYKAKIELIGYGVLIVALIIYLNLASGSLENFSQNRVLPQKPINEEKSEVHFLEQIDDNYEYDVLVQVVQKEEGEEEVGRDLHYVGKRVADQMSVVKTDSLGNHEYYKLGDYYYQLKEGVLSGGDSYLKSDFVLANEEEIYEGINSQYIDFSGLKHFLELSSLDHETSYSDGKKEYVYHLPVMSVLSNVQKDEVIPIQVSFSNDVWEVEVDYSSLESIISKKITSLKVKYQYTNVSKVKEFLKIEEKELG